MNSGSILSSESLRAVRAVRALRAVQCELTFLAWIYCGNDLTAKLYKLLQLTTYNALLSTEILLKITLFWRTWPINRSGLDILKSQQRRTRHSPHSPAIKRHLYLVTIHTPRPAVNPHPAPACRLLD